MEVKSINSRFIKRTTSLGDKLKKETLELLNNKFKSTSSDSEKLNFYRNEIKDSELHAIVGYKGKHVLQSKEQRVKTIEERIKYLLASLNNSKYADQAYNHPKLTDDVQNILNDKSYVPSILDVLRPIKNLNYGKAISEGRITQCEDMAVMHASLQIVKKCFCIDENLLTYADCDLKSNHIRQALIDHFLDKSRANLYPHAKINYQQICATPYFEDTFRYLTGQSLAQFMGVIYGASNSQMEFATEQSVIPSKAPFKPTDFARDNSHNTLTQYFVANNQSNSTIEFTTNISGYKTFGSAAQKMNPDLFGDESDHVAINHNSRVTTVNLDNQERYNYKLHTVGSYQIDNDGAVKNAQKLLTLIMSDIIPTQGKLENPQQAIIVDFKPLKRLYTGDHDSKILSTHTHVMESAVNDYNDNVTNEAEKVAYHSVWGNSHSIPLKAPPDSNKNFQKIIERLESVIEIRKSNPQANLDEDDAILNRLKAITNDISCFKKRGCFRLIFALTRILVAKYPESNIILMGGCMSAKDRMQSLSYASEIIIMLYHKRDNLDFINNDGRLIADKLSEDDKLFLGTLINNIIGQTYLSQQGIGRLNNKNLDLFANLFKDVPELYAQVNQNTFVNTSA